MNTRSIYQGPPRPPAWDDPCQRWPPRQMTWLVRWRLRRVSRDLREQLLRIAHEKESSKGDAHEDSDCGFQLLEELK